MNKSVSVIAPAFNHEKYIEACLWSIAQQDCKEMELIILDDCSEDRTRDVIRSVIAQKQFSERFSMGVKFVPHKENKGAHDTINEGLMMAKGNYLAVINTDDAFGENHLELLMDACEENGSEFAFGGVRVVDENDRPVTKGYGKSIMKYQDAALMCPTVTMALTRGNSTISTGNMVFTARLYQELGGFRNYKYVHDWDFALRAALITEPVFVPNACYVYRLHSGNTIAELANRSENSCEMEGKNEMGPNPLIEFLQKILMGQYTNERIPSREVWEYYFKYKKYFDDDFGGLYAWAEAKRLCGEG